MGVHTRIDVQKVRIMKYKNLVKTIYPEAVCFECLESSESKTFRVFKTCYYNDPIGYFGRTAKEAWRIVWEDIQGQMIRKLEG